MREVRGGRPWLAPRIAFGMSSHQQHRYAATVVWTGAKAGPTASYQSYSREYEYRCGEKAWVRGSADAQFRGDGTLYNPEELLVVALSTCHLLSYLALCARAKLSVVKYEDAALGTMADVNGVVRFTDVLLVPRVTIAAGADAAKAFSLHHDAHAECYIANSVNFPVRNQPIIVVA
jgi:organic hydroperoxide reductase OsmC/OhrA